MTDALIQLALFAAKTFIVLIFIALILILFVAILSKGKQIKQGKLTIKNLSKKYNETIEKFNAETASKKQHKQFLKTLKAKEKEQEKAKKASENIKNVYVLNFHGDIKASAVSSLIEEVNAILNVATMNDEIVLRLESAGGVVHGYGLAAAQLMRIRARQIPLTISVDKVAASGGYMMACVANKIMAAPFSIIGSIGVLVQLPNFNRVLKDKHIDIEQMSAGKYKRTLTIFGENTEEGRKKLQTEIEEVHELFKKLITDYRYNLDINKVATGEYWMGQQALDLKLIDEVKTGDEYLMELNKSGAKLYEVCYETKKPLMSKILGTASSWAIG